MMPTLLLDYFKRNAFWGYRNASQPKKKEIHKFLSHSISPFMHSRPVCARCLPFSHYRDNVHPCPCISLLCPYPIPLCCTFFWPQSSKSCTVISAAGQLILFMINL